MTDLPRPVARYRLARLLIALWNLLFIVLIAVGVAGLLAGLIGVGDLGPAAPAQMMVASAGLALAGLVGVAVAQFHLALLDAAQSASRCEALLTRVVAVLEGRDDSRPTAASDIHRYATGDAEARPTADRHPTPNPSRADRDAPARRRAPGGDPDSAPPRLGPARGD